MGQAELKGVMNDKLAYLVPVLYNIQKSKMGLHGREIPSDIKDEFVRGMIKLCRSEFEIDIDDPSYEQNIYCFIEKTTPCLD